MVEILQDIDKLQKVKSFLLQTMTLRDSEDASATLGVAIDKLDNLISDKQKIIKNFEESVVTNEEA